MARKSPDLVAALQKIGARVVELRAERAFTQEQLATAADLDVKHVQDVEHGRSNLTVATLLGIARALKTRVAILFDDL